MRGTDLVAKFSAFISNLESYRATEGYKPKVIDIRIWIDNSEQLELLANVTIGLEGIGEYTFPANNVDPKDAAQIYLTGSVTQASRLLNTAYMQVANPNGSQTPTGIFLSSVVSNNVNITQDLAGNNFYFGFTSSPYLATFFQQEHDAIYNKVLNYCGQQNIPSTKLWSISVNYDITVKSNSYIRHKVTTIKTAEVNVM